MVLATLRKGVGVVAHQRCVLTQLFALKAVQFVQ